MTKITINEDDENSPQKQFIQDFNIAFAKGDMEYVLNCFSEDILWDVVNHEPVRGKEAVREMLSEMDEVASELVIDTILVDGDRCVANGRLTYADSTVAFSDMYVFAGPAENLRIQTLTGYAIDLKEV